MTEVEWDTPGICNLRYKIAEAVALAIESYGHSTTLEFSTRREANLFIKFLVPELVKTGYLPVVTFFGAIPTAELFW